MDRNFLQNEVLFEGGFTNAITKYCILQYELLWIIQLLVSYLMIRRKSSCIMQDSKPISRIFFVYAREWRGQYLKPLMPHLNPL